MRKAERIRCSAPLPENSADQVLTRMLALAPYQVSLRQGKERSGEAQSGLHTTGASRTIFGEIRTPVSEDEQGGESTIPSPHGKKRTTLEDLEAKVSKRGKKPSLGGPALEGNLTA